MIDTFLLTMSDGRKRIGFGEMFSVLALSVRLRAGGADATPRVFAWREAIRLVVLLIALSQAITALASFVYMLQYGVFGAGTTTWVVVASTSRVIVFTGLYLALLFGRRQIALTFVALAAVVVIGPGVMARLARPDMSFGDAFFLAFFFALVVLSVGVLVAFRNGERRPRVWPWLVAAAAGTAVVSAEPVWYWLVPAVAWDWLPFGVLVGLVVGSLVCAGWLRPAIRASWSVAALATATVSVIYEAVYFAEMIPGMHRAGVPVSIVPVGIAAGVLLVLAVPVFFVARHAYRKLPVSG